MKKIINMTPHAVIFIEKDGETIETIAPSGAVARVTTQIVVTGEINGIPVTTTEFGEVEGLPQPEEGVIYVVSSLVAQCCQGRNDVFIPNEPVRDDQGRIVGCKSLGRI